jgi:putative glutamine amidotransferase
MRRPLVGVTADLRTYNNSLMHTVGDKYARAVWEASGCTPMIIPAMAESQEVHDMLDALDGLLFTGSPSNVHPTRYGQEANEKAEPYDETRDAMTLPLIDAALEKGLPLLFVCRGFQELNVALGGTLHPRLHEVEGRLDHRMPKSDDTDVRYGPRHSMTFTPEGHFAKIAGAT